MSLKKIISVVAIGAGIGTAVKFVKDRKKEDVKSETTNTSKACDNILDRPYDDLINDIRQMAEEANKKAEEFGLPVLVFKTKKKAEEVLSALHDELAKTGIANAQTMYKEAGVQHIPEEAATVHWRDLTGVEVRKLNDKKWIITFPEDKE